jgi:hypothetical protein
MGGFKNKSNNVDFEQNLFSLIISHIHQCCKKMSEDCRETGNHLYNHEDKISNRLVEKYLNVYSQGLVFTLQNPVHYDTETDTHKGIADITVRSADRFMNSDSYYTIEAKRLDGRSTLNKKYVSHGISRYVIPSPPKYPSYYGKNIMLGYIVKTINVIQNVRTIDKLQHELLFNISIGKMRFVCDDGKDFSRYQCLYKTDNKFSVELTHLFYDFSEVILANKK